MMKKQRGLTAISWIIVIAIIGVQGLMALRIAPLYMNFNSAKTVMESLKTDPQVSGKTTKQIRTFLRKRLDVNGLYELRDSKDAFKFSKSKKGTKLVLHYEERGPIFGNLEFVATFNYEIELPRRTSQSD